MKNLIKKIIKEEFEDFGWAKQIDPLLSFEEYFYNNEVGKYIRRDIDWWEDWVDDVYGAYSNILEEFNEVNDMVKELVEADDASEKNQYIVKELSSMFLPNKYLNNLISSINTSYDYFGNFARENNLSILDVMNIFRQWLYKKREMGEPLHRT
jgi:hypothetical protein